MAVRATLLPFTQTTPNSTPPATRACVHSPTLDGRLLRGKGLWQKTQYHLEGLKSPRNTSPETSETHCGPSQRGVTSYTRSRKDACTRWAGASWEDRIGC